MILARSTLVLLWLCLCFPVTSSETSKSITIQPLGQVPTSHINAVRDRIKEQHRLMVVIAKPVPMPSLAFHKPRSRYRAEKILKWLNARTKTDYILGVTTKDISTTLGNKSDWGIFGLGYMPGNAAVVSSFRLKSSGKISTTERLARVASHEVGHNRGLPHCQSLICVMRDAEGGLANLDQSKDFCKSCSAQLKGSSQR